MLSTILMNDGWMDVQALQDVQDVRVINTRTNGVTSRSASNFHRKPEEKAINSDKLG